MEKSPSESFSLSTKTLTLGGAALLVTSLAAGVCNCVRSNVDYHYGDSDPITKEGQFDPTTSVIGSLFGINMIDECSPVSYALPPDGVRWPGGSDQYVIVNTVVCNRRKVRDLMSKQEFHRPETTREKIAAHAGNTAGGLAGLGITALGGTIALARSQKRRRKS